MLLTRNDLISTLFRETDRAQRMKTPLALIDCAIADWAKWQSELLKSDLDIVTAGIADRMTRLLRCYDSVGLLAEGEFVLLLPGCALHDAARMAERLNAEVFSSSMELHQRRIQFTACFGVVTTEGRSPLILLREANHALQLARAQGAGSIACPEARPESDSAGYSLPVFRNPLPGR